MAYPMRYVPGFREEAPECNPSRWWESPSRVWNLWEIMNEFDLNGFELAMRTLRNFASKLNPTQPFVGMPRSTLQEFRRCIDLLVEQTARLKLTGSAASARNIAKIFHDRPVLDDQIVGGEKSAKIDNLFVVQLIPLINELDGRWLEEIAAVKMVLIPFDKSEWLRSNSQFSALVRKQFPCLAYELDEAQQCYALDRSTACAFHSIRSLEAGIRAISRSLGIPDPTKGAQRSWAKLLEAIKAEIDKRWPRTSDRFSGDGKTFEGFYAPLAAMQNPYRNNTMHLDEKYTEKEAKQIMDIVAGFLHSVATRCDEDGKPLA